MSEITSNTEARERVLEAAERLFAGKGYTAVTLRDIAAEVGIKHTSLYHHVPGGKEELFIEVTVRGFEQHRAGLNQAIHQAEPDVQSRLRVVAEWLLSHPPIDLIRLTYSDMPAIAPAQAERLSELAFESLIMPVTHLLEQAQQQGEIAHHDLGLIAGGFIGMIESLHSVPEYVLEGGVTRITMAYELIEVLLNGLRQR
ncbi:MAG: TetR/AcrR family transcriptional regulator [Anaerolineales bacterium]|nr:TetR/AcrR family transcriptional regulator [Anaerolineales bacterium]